ncbi:GNAT family acetyltransferase [Rhodopseudomonas sp. P2A-2r]|uniref:GNAT family acetyltransferase n=1 Tax=unclassified Rhodopseudomonas TaxID=2638247 RepID=UPI0022347B64|nr:GNAT family acetyltransferase [Rhodopseudomonas sp. P2A-2r]UZE50571.1 GNAT family acetyltransferase [Rhodopseudomonas sp. P2A-2r]
MKVSSLTDADIAGVIALWRRCGLVRPWNDPEADIRLARSGNNADVLVGHDGDSIVASVLVGHDGHRGWVYYVSVDPDHQRRDFGRAIMTAAENWLRARGIEKLQLMVRGDNTRVKAFYESIGFGEQERVIYAKWLDGRELTP